MNIKKFFILMEMKGSGIVEDKRSEFLEKINDSLEDRVNLESNNEKNFNVLVTCDE